MRFLFIIAILSYHSLALAQWKLPIHLVVGKEKFELNTYYSIENSTITLSKVRFYLMNLKVYSKGQEMNMISQAILVDAEKENFILMNGQEPKIIDSIIFLLGTSNDVNENLVLEGDLDPINGMYWAWNSGYINLKIEGIFTNEFGKKEIEYHLGGFQQEFSTAQNLKIVPLKTDYEFKVDLKKVIQILLSESAAEIMIPGRKASNLMKNIAKNLEE